MLMQVAESYLMDRIGSAMAPWIARQNAAADKQLQQAIRLLRYHTQVGGTRVLFFCA